MSICPDCNAELHIGDHPFCHGDPAAHATAMPMVIGDELHDYSAKHGVCWPDGTPRKFNSKTELKRALNEAGLTIAGDSPKPYPVHWSGVRNKE